MISVSSDNTKLALNVPRTGTSGPSTYIIFYGYGSSSTGPLSLPPTVVYPTISMVPTVLLSQTSTFNFNGANDGITLAFYFYQPSATMYYNPTLGSFQISNQPNAYTCQIYVRIRHGYTGYEFFLNGLYFWSNSAAPLDQWVSLVITLQFSTNACAFYVNGGYNYGFCQTPSQKFNFSSLGVMQANMTLGNLGDNVTRCSTLDNNNVPQTTYFYNNENFVGYMAAASVHDYAADVPTMTQMYNYHLSL